MTTNRTRRHASSSIVALKARTTRTFDSNGECEHRTISRAFGHLQVIWSTRDECIWCGDGREWH